MFARRNGCRSTASSPPPTPTTPFTKTSARQLPPRPSSQPGQRDGRGRPEQLRPHPRLSTDVRSTRCAPTSRRSARRRPDPRHGGRHLSTRTGLPARSARACGYRALRRLDCATAKRQLPRNGPSGPIPSIRGKQHRPPRSRFRSAAGVRQGGRNARSRSGASVEAFKEYLAPPINIMENPDIAPNAARCRFRRIVEKGGQQLSAHRLTPRRHARYDRREALADLIAALHRACVEVIVVTVGRCRRRARGDRGRPLLDAVSARQLYSAVGQGEAVPPLLQLFDARGIVGGQCSPPSRISRPPPLPQPAQTASAEARNGVVPIVYENDRWRSPIDVFTDNDELRGCSRR